MMFGVHLACNSSNTGLMRLTRATAWDFVWSLADAIDMRHHDHLVEQLLTTAEKPKELARETVALMQHLLASRRTYVATNDIDEWVNCP